MPDNTPVVNTVLGPVPADQLGTTVVHAALLSVYPGAEYAPDITIDRAEIFEILRTKLHAFYEAGGRTIVDATGMFHGRNLPFTLDLLENLSRSTGVNIIASTGMGPEEMLGGYFLTPQTNPPTPWPAEKFADLFSKEITEGMVVPRVERRAAAGLITSLSSASGMTATDESLLRGAVRAALATGVAVSHAFGADALAEIGIALDEGISPNRLVIRGLARPGAPVLEVAATGVYLGIDEITPDTTQLLKTLIDAGHRDRIILSASAVGVAKGHDASETDFSALFTDVLPALRAVGISDADITAITVNNPRELLALV
ncbi:phosphotriesterase [Corynebacterium callunae]|uniref:phosphotriesterase family protein n=1 Tax=Corynebacterium callunae TaxID=1721 RepID=UPI001FFFEC29|nr:phosphotriesterase [Corynebacterium callunae]MCK2199478.1 phosphotriesterase [Corynebacterium callunae]